MALDHQMTVDSCFLNDQNQRQKQYHTHWYANIASRSQASLNSPLRPFGTHSEILSPFGIVVSLAGRLQLGTQESDDGSSGTRGQDYPTHSSSCAVSFTQRNTPDQRSAALAASATMTGRWP